MDARLPQKIDNYILKTLHIPHFPITAMYKFTRQKQNKYFENIFQNNMSLVTADSKFFNVQTPLIASKNFESLDKLKMDYGKKTKIMWSVSPSISNAIKYFTDYNTVVCNFSHENLQDRLIDGDKYGNSSPDVDGELYRTIPGLYPSLLNNEIAMANIREKTNSDVIVTTSFCDDLLVYRESHTYEILSTMRQNFVSVVTVQTPFPHIGDYENASIKECDDIYNLLELAFATPLIFNNKKFGHSPSAIIFDFGDFLPSTFKSPYNKYTNHIGKNYNNLISNNDHNHFTRGYDHICTISSNESFHDLQNDNKETLAQQFFQWESKHTT